MCVCVCVCVCVCCCPFGFYSFCVVPFILSFCSFLCSRIMSLLTRASINQAVRAAIATVFATDVETLTKGLNLCEPLDGSSFTSGKLELLQVNSFSEPYVSTRHYPSQSLFCMIAIITCTFTSWLPHTCFASFTACF